MIVTQPDRVLLTEQIARHAPTLTGSLLDVGSGRYRRYKDLFTNVTSYRTLDTNPDWQPDILGSAEAIPLPDKSVDSVLCTQVLEHVPHPHKVIAEIARVLKPGGYCLLTAPFNHELHEEPHDYFRYTPYGLETLFTEAGLTVESSDQRGKYHSARMNVFIRHLINRYQPYQHKAAMYIIGPLSLLLSKWAIWRDSRTTHSSFNVHAIGWCVLARKR